MQSQNEIKFITIDYMYEYFVCYQYNFIANRGQRAVSKVVIPLSNLHGERRSIRKLISIYTRIRNELLKFDGCIVTFHPLIGLAMLLNKISSRGKMNNKWAHWFTGQIWANSPRVLSVYRWLDLAISKKADVIITDSVAQSDFLVSSGFDHANIVSVAPGTVSGVAVRELNKINKKNVANPVVGYVGRISKAKGFLTAVSWAETTGRELHVFGKLDDLSLKSYLLSKNVVYHGETCCNLQIYENIDILLQPSFREGFSTVIIEAQAAGIPVICRDIYGNKGAIINEKSGLYFRNDSEINFCFEKIVANYSKFSRQARLFSQSFAREKVLINVMEIYEKIF